VVAERRRQILIQPNRVRALLRFRRVPNRRQLAGFCTATKHSRGGVNSERHVHPCGKRPRPTGRDNIVDAKTPGLLANKLLAALPHDDLSLLQGHFTIEPLAQNTSLFNVDDEVEQVSFPLSGMVSLLVILNNGDAVETATVGREGVVACNISHQVEARFCRWLLQSHDRAESDTVPLTQEFLSEMLGVRRTSVTQVAIKMQDAGVISYTRGIIKILDLASLKKLSCECYETLRDETPR
jgi:Crp-like helix-turn-helix domain